MIPYKIELTIERPPDVAQRKWLDFMRDAHTEQGEHWHQQILPEHFTPSARYRYGHRPRSRKYVQKKQRLAARGKVRLGGRVDIVHSGLLMDTLTNFATVRGFPARTTIVMQGPRYITMRPRAGQIDKAQELTTVTAQEDRELSEQMGERVTTRLDALRQPQTIKV